MTTSMSQRNYTKFTDEKTLGLASFKSSAECYTPDRWLS
jgi:hypothetical protein